MATTRYLDQPFILAGRRIDPISGTVNYQGTDRRLRRKELEVLALLASADSDYVARSALIEHVWQGNSTVGEQGLTDTIAALRRSLVDSNRDSPLIQTIPRRGYRLRGCARPLTRTGDLLFTPGSAVEGHPGTRLIRLLEQTEAYETWLTENGHSNRVFRFCRSEQHLRILRREVAIMHHLKDRLSDCADISIIIDWQFDEPPYFIEMAAPAYGNLREVVTESNARDTPELYSLLAQVAQALARLHAVGIVHRALRPESVLIDARGSKRTALLAGFGAATLSNLPRTTHPTDIAEGFSLSTGLTGPATIYTAPECRTGKSETPASDIYALGVLIAQTITGAWVPQEEGSIQQLPSELSELVRKCVTADPAVRASAEQAAVALRTLARSTNTASQSPRGVPQAAMHIDAEWMITETLPTTSDGRSQYRQKLRDPAKGCDVSSACKPVASATSINREIGKYRLSAELGQGCMGVVYLAEQREPVQRRVAIKLIRADLDSAQILARFEAERQALAMMNHPNIAAIFEAGSTNTGDPYFVMEFVPGKDLISHCDHDKLSVRERIRLFLQVCDGVLHAHQKGLIHRDLKPSNILVKQRSDLPPQVKLIDFGVAKSLTGNLGGTLQTQIGSFIGTPVYSCPEQIINPTNDIDTRADLYSLGVVLYELLTGLPPRPNEDLEASTLAELARRIRDVKPPPMATRYNALEILERDRIAKLRCMSSQTLTADLQSDLDWIVAKCIEQDPEDRYATIQDLRQDLQRWINGLPVEARRSNAWYRFRKAIRRNRFEFSLAAITLFALIATSTAAVTGYLSAERARRDAERAVDFQVSMLSSIDPSRLGGQLRDSLIERIGARGHGPSDTAHMHSEEIRRLEEILNNVNFTDLGLDALDSSVFDPALRAIGTEFSGNPALQGELAQSLADIWFTLGRYQKALDTQEWALSLRYEAFGSNDRRTLHSAWRRAQIHAQLGNLETAEALYRETLERMRRTLGVDDSLTIAAMNKAATLYAKIGRIDEAEGLLREILRLTPQGPLIENSESLEAINNLGGLMLDKGNLDEAERLITRALEARRQLLGNRHLHTLNSLSDLSLVAHGLRDYDRANALSEQALTGYRELAGEMHPDTLQVLGNFVSNLVEQGNYGKAEVLAEELLTQSTQV